MAVAFLNFETVLRRFTSRLIYINWLPLCFRLDFWSEIRSVYKLSMETMKSYAQKCISSKFNLIVSLQ